MAETDAAQPTFVRGPAANKEHNFAASVLGAYTAAIVRSKNERSAFAAAVRSYLLYHPNVPELSVVRVSETTGWVK